MLWQDIVISVVQWIFALALLPTIRSASEKPPLMTSITTGISLLVLGATFGTLHLWSSVVSSLAASCAWFIIGYQKYSKKSIERTIQ